MFTIRCRGCMAFLTSTPSPAAIYLRSTAKPGLSFAARGITFQVAKDSDLREQTLTLDVKAGIHLPVEVERPLLLLGPTVAALPESNLTRALVGSEGLQHLKRQRKVRDDNEIMYLECLWLLCEGGAVGYLSGRKNGK